MAGQHSTYESEVRDTVVKSSFTGIAATVIAIAAFSPAGFGDWIGASVASSFGIDANADAADNPYASLPAYPAPLSQAELEAIHTQLASSEASLALLRAATNDKIEHVRALAMSDGVVTFTPVRHSAPESQQELRLALSEPTSFATGGSASEAPVEAYVIESAPVEATTAPVSHAVAFAAPYRDPHLELADLLLAHETF